MTSVDSPSTIDPISSIPALRKGYFLIGGEVIRGQFVSPASTDPDYAGNQELWSEDGITLRDVWLAIHTGKEVPPAVADFSSTYPRLHRSAGNSTADSIEQELLCENELTGQFVLFIRDAENEHFEDGMGSEFATRVHESMVNYGSVAVAAWERILWRMGNVNETGEELLRQFGLIENEPSRERRLRVLKDSLKSPDPRIRDAAGLGLSFLDDPSVLPALQTAHETETEGWLRDNLSLVIEQFTSNFDADIPQSSA